MNKHGRRINREMIVCPKHEPPEVEESSMSKVEREETNVDKSVVSVDISVVKTLYVERSRENETVKLPVWKTWEFLEQ
jgi:hypothetical protein